MRRDSAGLHSSWMAPSATAPTRVLASRGVATTRIDDRPTAEADGEHHVVVEAPVGAVAVLGERHAGHREREQEGDGAVQHSGAQLIS